MDMTRPRLLLVACLAACTGEVTDDAGPADTDDTGPAELDTQDTDTGSGVEPLEYATISGMVRRYLTGEPLAGAQVTWHEGGTETVTNATGAWTLDVAVGIQRFITT